MALSRIICRKITIFRINNMSVNLSTGSKILEKAFDEIKNNPYFNKYADKIAALQHESPEELKKRLEEYEKNKQKQETIVQSKERPYSVASMHCKSGPSDAAPKPKALNDIMKLELLKDKNEEEIKQIWLDYHRSKDAVASIVPKAIFNIINARGKEFPTFLLPIPRSQGYEFIMCQFLTNEVHFTPLIAYQTHKENAPECLTLTFYSDLQEEKGIVLMKGEFDTNILNAQEAQCLVNELQLYYAQDNPKRVNLLKKFTFKPSEFNHMDLIKELETLSL